MIESGRGGSGNGEVNYRVARNEDSNRRSGTMSIAGRPFRVEQEGAPNRDKPEKVDVDGRVSSLGGSCPSLSFTVDGHSVVTDGSTDFRRGSCRDIRNGVEVEVKGERRGSGPIRAERVEIEDDDDNN